MPWRFVPHGSNAGAAPPAAGRCGFRFGFASAVGNGTASFCGLAVDKVP
jgi:hypothetical protein